MTSSTSAPARQVFWRYLEPFIGLLVVLTIFALLPDTRRSLFTGGSFGLILLQSVVVALGALGMTIIIVSGGIDLSAGSVVALTTVVCARLIQQGASLPVVVLAALATGGLVGLGNGALIAGLRMAPFIVTLGMMGIARGLAKGIAANQTVNYSGQYPDHPIGQLARRAAPADFWPLAPAVWVAIVMAVLMTIALSRTVFGRRVFAIGSNEATARLCGVGVGWNKLAIYAAAGLFFGLAGLVQLSRLNQGDPSVAVGLELEIIAAVVIGGASLSGGSGTILGALIGALIMGILRRGTTLLNFQHSHWQNSIQEIIIGVVIIVAVFIDRLRAKGT